MAKKPTTIHERTLKRFQEPLVKIDEAIAEADQYALDKHNEAVAGAEPMGLSLFMLMRSAMALRSVKRLFINGYNDDALSVMRTIAELLIDLRFIRIDPVTLSSLYNNFPMVANWRRYEQLSKIPALAAMADPASVAKIRADHDKHIGDYPDPPRQWHKFDLRSRAIHTDKAAQAGSAEPIGSLLIYDLAYRTGCEATHSSTGTLQGVFDSAMVRGHLSSQPEECTSSIAPYLAMMCFIYLFLEVRETFGEHLLDGPRYLQGYLNSFTT